MEALDSSRTSVDSPVQHSIRMLDETSVARWDEFVEACEEATFFHKSGWKSVIEKAYGHRVDFLYAEKDGSIEGILPLAQVKSWLFGNSLISLPFCVYGGAAAINDAARSALISHAVKMAEDLSVDYLEMRNVAEVNSDWLSKDLYVTFRKEIAADPEQILADIPRKQRAMVRKGIKAGLVSEMDEDVDRLYAAYSESVRNLGTPVFPKRYFQLLKEEFGDDCEILTVINDGRVVSSVMSFYFRDQVLPYYGGGTAEARACKANDFMYWEVMRRSAEKGIRIFDYGRSKVGTGAYSFKKNWGFEPAPLHYEYYLVKADRLPDISPKNPKYKYFIEAWSRLPLGLSRVLGPMLSKYLG